MKTAEIKELTTQEMKLNHSISPLDNPLQIKAARRNIARLATELRAREINK